MGNGDVGEGQGPKQHCFLVVSSCVLSPAHPRYLLSHYLPRLQRSPPVSAQSLPSPTSELEQLRDGLLCAVGSPWRCPAQFRSPGEVRGCRLGGVPGGGRGRLAGPVYPCPCPCPFFALCFVLSGPRLHPWQKEGRNPTKVSAPPTPAPTPAAYGWGSLIPQGMGGKVCWGGVVGLKGHRKLGPVI